MISYITTLSQVVVGGWNLLEILAPAGMRQVGLGLDLFLLTLHPPVASQNSDNFTIVVLYHNFQ